MNNYQGALQQRLGTGFSHSSTAADVIKGISLAGKTAIVTGGNTGIGLQTTKTLAAAGATVIVAARDVEKARKNLSGIRNTEIMWIDMMDPASIDGFAEKYLSEGEPLHLLINNAGIMWVPFRKDSRGIESQLATNYISQFHLTARLWPALKLACGARIVNLSSLGHHMAPFDFSDPNFSNRPYETLAAYG
ncbi:MAG: SDR family NAD(P)-dependent oxidoreductase, partial [Sphingobacteriales bacterium]